MWSRHGQQANKLPLYTIQQTDAISSGETEETMNRDTSCSAINGRSFTITFARTKMLQNAIGTHNKLTRGELSIGAWGFSWTPENFWNNKLQLALHQANKPQRAEGNRASIRKSDAWSKGITAKRRFCIWQATSKGLGFRTSKRRQSKPRWIPSCPLHSGGGRRRRGRQREKEERTEAQLRRRQARHGGRWRGGGWRAGERPDEWRRNTRVTSCDFWVVAVVVNLFEENRVY